ncbi:MAG: TAXI family TRAP transporter solute-binding subunit [bacterium]|nr:TAXI family TRAP transporter solute-binding subunit [bacterium]
MLKKFFIGVVVVTCVISFGGHQELLAKDFLAMGGGPVGGTFNYFSNAIAIYLSKNLSDVEVSSEGSGGSGENLRRVHRHDVDFGITYAGDIFLGRNGKLPKDDTEYVNVRPLAYLYGAPAQLIVLKKSGITSAKQLEGKKVAVGNAGSGAALSAERFFTSLGLWDKISPQFLGYSPAASAFKDRKIDAFWVLVGYPNSSIIEAATQDDIALINVYKDAQESEFFNEYPFYSKRIIPANTYRGQEEDVESFQDSAYWTASKDVTEELVYNAMKAVFAAEGLEHMRAAHKAAAAMSIESGISGLSAPLHKGAYKFWTEQGVNVPDEFKSID